jgi:putative membrane protein
MEQTLFHQDISLILNNIFMKKLSIGVIITGALIFSACNGNSNSSTTTDTTTTTSSSDTSMNSMNMNSTDTTSVGEDAKDFTKDAAQGGLFEVKAGAIAERNATSQDVKDFGKMMVEDHTQLNQQLQELAAKKNVPLPSEITNSQQDDTTKLSKEKGAEFDKDYISMMVKDHEKDIDAFKKAADKVTDQDYKNLITGAIPTLQKHLDAAKKIKDKLK